MRLQDFFSTQDGGAYIFLEAEILGHAVNQKRITLKAI